MRKSAGYGMDVVNAAQKMLDSVTAPCLGINKWFMKHLQPTDYQIVAYAKPHMSLCSHLAAIQLLLPFTLPAWWPAVIYLPVFPVEPSQQSGGPGGLW